jgi:hypothetical protein
LINRLSQALKNGVDGGGFLRSATGKMALAVGDLRAIIVRAAIVNGVLAQLVERLNGIEEVRGSNPLGSTTFFGGVSRSERFELQFDYPAR